jgi:hypothetical protein
MLLLGPAAGSPQRRPFDLAIGLLSWNWGCNEDRSGYIAAGGLFVCPSGGCAPLPELAHLGIKTVLDLRGAMIHKPREGKLVQAAGMQ